ncbi:MAG: hypothetical protein J2P49_07745 [Methylocapsa sp.]|nr:hypothetical protein [Methylocapsa sp.]
MIRLVACCLWLIAVTALAAYIAATWNFNEPGVAALAKKSAGIQGKKIAPVNVPMISNGAVEGYVVAQFVYLADEDGLRGVSVPPEDFIADEAFRVLYGSQIDFHHLEKYDVDQLTKTIAQRVNQRLGKNIVTDILVAEFNYIPKRELAQ